MDRIENFLTDILHVVFAQDPTANVGLAMLYTFILFSALYSILVGCAYYLLEAKAEKKKVVIRPVPSGQVRQEILSSIISIFMFTLVGAGAYLSIQQGFLNVSLQTGVWQWLLEVIILFVWNDVHFYFSHRLLHTPWLYKRIHIHHHRSVIVTPFSVWRFHWLEALWLGAVLPMALLFFSFSIWSLAMLPLISLFWNIIGHSNWRSDSYFTRIFSAASERHAMHHSQINGNFGFALPYFDRWLGTGISRDTRF